MKPNACWISHYIDDGMSGVQHSRYRVRHHQLRINIDGNSRANELHAQRMFAKQDASYSVVNDSVLF